ncbi:MAG TPA: LanC-like protein [Gaiellaceae bacterium]
MTLYEQAAFEPLVDAPWDEGRVRDAIAAVVADTDAGFDPKELWPATDPVDEYGRPTKVLYVGAAGTIWALDELRRRGYAETSIDLTAAVIRTLELERADPDAANDEHYRPGSLFDGTTGPAFVGFRLTSDVALADELHALVLRNVDNPTDDVNWGAPGTILVALAMHARTGEERWEQAAKQSAAALHARRGNDHAWRQDDDYRGLGTLHGVAGNTLALLRVEPDDGLARESAAVLSHHAVREEGLANWPGALGRPLVRPRDGSICLQWCTGAPGVLAGSWDYLDEELVLAGAELTWQAGAHREEKGHGLCHGTSGNGFALLKAFARTGDELWLERARRFAVHALAQAECMTAARGSRRYSLFNGDPGTALFAAACVDADPRFPIVDVI